MADGRRRHHDGARARPDARRSSSPRRWCAGMRPGSVIVDLAAEQGGNCALTEPGEDVVRHGVTILGPTNLPSHDAVPRQPDVRAQRRRASCCISCKDGALQLDLERRADARAAGDARAARSSTRRSAAALASDGGRHDDRARSRPLHLHAGRLPRLSHHHARAAAAAHAADVGDQRHLGHLAGRLAGRRRARDYEPRSARCSASSPSPARRPTSSAASSSPTACCGCSRRESEPASAARSPARRRSSLVVRGRCCWSTRRCLGACGSREHVAQHVLSYCYILSAVLFILGLKGLSSPSGRGAGMFARRVRHGRSPSSARCSTTTSSATGGSRVGLAIGAVVGGIDGPAHSDDRGAAADRAVALARRAGGDASSASPSTSATAADARRA